MTRKREPSQPRVGLSPVKTVAHLSDDFIRGLNIPVLPDQIPARLEDSLRRRVQAFLFYLAHFRRQRLVGALEIRLVRDAQQAVLAAHELGLVDADRLYAEFRHLVEDLGYERTEVGFSKRQDGNTES